MLDAVVHALERMLGMRLYVPQQIVRTPCEAVHALHRQMARVARRLYGLHLQAEPAVAVPPFGVLQAVFAPLHLPARRPAPASLAELRIVKVVHRLLRHRQILYLRHLDAGGSEVEQIADEIGVPRVFDAELNRNVQLGGVTAELRQRLFVERRMLAVGMNKVVIVLAQDVLHLALSRRQRRRHADEYLPVADALLHSFAVWHSSSSLS